MLQNIILILVTCLSTSSLAEIKKPSPILQYYWRDYNGKIPPDAFVAGFDKNVDPLYVGQAYLKDHGLIPCQINSDVNAVKVPFAGKKVTNKGIYILCGEPENFEWISTNKTTIAEDVKGKHLIIGGHEDGKGNYNIGRVKHEGEWRIGKVNTFWPERSPNQPEMYFVYNDKEIKSAQYQVLAVKPLTLDIDVRTLK